MERRQLKLPPPLERLACGIIVEINNLGQAEVMPLVSYR
jgi:hypothetical protein